MILQRYISRELLITFLVTLTAVLTIMVVVALFQIFRELSSPGIAFVVKVFPSLLGYIAPYAILLSAGIAPTLVYGRLAADNEIDAMRAHGHPVGRILVPALILGLAVTTVSYAVNEYATPKAHYKRRQHLRESAIMLLRSPPRGQQVHRIGQFVLSYQDAHGSSLVIPVITRHNLDGTVVERFWAERGTVEFAADGSPSIRLVQIRYYRKSLDQVIRGSNPEAVFRIDLKKYFDRPKGASDMTAPELLDYIRHPDTPERKVRRARTEYYGRFGRSFAALLLTLLGACVGLITRKGSRLAGLGASLPVVVGYFIFWALGKVFGEKGQISAGLAACLPSMALMVVILLLAWRIFRR